MDESYEEILSVCKAVERLPGKRRGCRSTEHGTALIQSFARCLKDPTACCLNHGPIREAQPLACSYLGSTCPPLDRLRLADRTGAQTFMVWTPEAAARERRIHCAFSSTHRQSIVPVAHRSIAFRLPLAHKAITDVLVSCAAIKEKASYRLHTPADALACCSLCPGAVRRDQARTCSVS